LRLADYNQGRRFGNGSGQAGAFGFSGFGGQTSNATSNSFGAQPANTSSPFGGGQANNVFGNTNTGGSLFGQANKPATGGLFGNNAPTPQPSGGLFGTSNNTNAGFGGFGNQQQEQPKAGFSFGNTNPSTGFGSGGTGFGSNNTNTNTGGGLFGNNNNQQPNTGFGNNQQQQPASNPFGGFGANAQNQNQSNTNPAFGGFGQNNQQKPGGLFGNNPTTNTTGGLFSGTPTNQQQQQPAGGLFGNNNNNNTQQSGTSLFGKPASTGTSLFGNNNATSATNPGTSLFGAGLNNNNANQGQQNQGGGLFGNNNNQQQQQPGGLFANSNSTGGGLFGSNNNQQQPAGGSLFGPTTSNNQQQQQPGGLFGSSNNNNASVLNTSQQQQNALAPPQTLTASLLDRYPYGSASIFDGLPPPPQASPVPMATPINGSKTIRKSAIPPTYKINPTQSTSRLVTPRRPAGYGFTYSTYGTPSSAASNISTPGGFSSSLLHSSISRGLGKSLSTSNLRRSFDSDGESLLSPGAFSAGSSRYSGGGSLKRLNIDRSLRTDLFGNGGAAAMPSPDKSDQSRQPGILKKKVSFDTNTVGGNENGEDGTLTNGTTATDSNNSAQPSAQEQGFLRSSRGGNKFGGAKVNGISSQPEMEQVKGNELAIVHEDGPPETTAPSKERLSSQVSHEDPQPREYYMRPSKADIDKMSREQKSRVTDFEVGREGCGHAVFNEPVDLNSVNLEDIPDKIAQITLRSLTIYPDSTNKPPVGMGLNVPSTIYLENSWPRQRDRKAAMYEKSGPRFNRHLEKLRKVPGTDFVSYNADTGVWVFTVPHFTTYALEYEDTASEGDTLQMSTMNSDQNTPTPRLRHVQGGSGSSKLTSLRDSTVSLDPPSYASSSPDDTFEFRKKKLLPGAFDDSAASDEDDDMEDASQTEKSFLEDSLAASPSESGIDEPSEVQAGTGGVEDRSLVIRDDDMDMAGSFPQPELHERRSLLGLSQQDMDVLGTPKRLEFSVTGDWADDLQRTISPRKQDRQALRENQAYMKDDSVSERNETPKVKVASIGTGNDLATSIDLMNSIFGKEQARKSQTGLKQSSKGKGFEV
jgi:nuclear pore complex protein Nup98-Nup96